MATGPAIDTPAYSGAVTIALTTVLLASAPLFGIALTALGVAGYRLKRRTTVAVP